MTTPKNPHAIDTRIREGLSRLATVLRVDDWNRAKAAGLNPTQLAILTLLDGRGARGLGVKEIAAHLGVSQPTATDSLNALERRGLLAKHPGESDRRAVNIAPTAEGTATLRATEAGDGLVEQAIAGLDDREQEDLLLTLIKMIRHLQDTDAIPVQRLCVTCRHFAPFAHADAARPHHCHYVDAAFGQPDLRLDCREHEANPASRAATRDASSPG
ncbi:MarR family winged helix-turn-helix transcriptional regulator [Shinella sp. G-2]|uniref:MarR family winged helix-turn-helix transcriptional regulator n=1 Tax=Shinella sp. G-2 TaxID=3133141 RepID=UPI003CFFB861